MSEQPKIANKMGHYLVDTHEVLNLLAPSVAAGLDLTRLLSSVDLPPDFFNATSDQVDIEDCWRIFNAQYNMVAEESHQLSQRPLSRGTTRLVFNNLLHCATLEEGLTTLAETYNVIHGGNFNSVKKRGKTLSYIVDDRNFHYTGPPQYFAIEFALLRVHCVLSFLTKTPLRLLRVKTLRPELPSFNHHLNLFSTGIQLSQNVYELVYDAAQSECAFKSDENVDINGNLLGYYVAQLREASANVAPHENMTSAVKAILVEHFARQMPCDQSSVAEAFHMSVATLRRRLKDEGVNFRSVLDQVNAEQAVNVLLEFQSSEKAAEKLDYCDVRSFKRAFRRWHGVSPAVYLRKHLRSL